MRLHLSVAILAGITSLSAETHQFAPEQYYKTFSHSHPVGKRIQPGDIVVTKTLDSAGVDYKGEQKATGPGGNPLTGPFFVEGAEPGDALVVKLRKVRLNRNSGYSGYRLGTYSVLS